MERKDVWAYGMVRNLAGEVACQERWVLCSCRSLPAFNFLVAMLEEREAGDRTHAQDVEWDVAYDEDADLLVGNMHCAPTSGDSVWVCGRWAVPFPEHRLIIVSPAPYHCTDVCMNGHRHMAWLLRVRARILSEQAYISTLGGGFASVRNVPKAIEYAVKLFYCACLLADEDGKSKSRLFVGWSMLFLGNKARARSIFLAEIEDAKRRHDEVAHQRGLGAMNHLRNPVYKENGDVVPDVSLKWHQVFNPDEGTRNAVQEKASSASCYEISEMASKDEE